MTGYGKRLSFSSPSIKSFASSEGSNENGRSNQEMDLNSHNPKKENFMSPSVSFALNINFPTKKILAERNESSGSNFSNTQISNPLNLDCKAFTGTITKISHRNSPNSDPKLSSNKKCETPSPDTYDPLTNYLSPRPQFLRYNPDRQKEIFLRLKMEDKEEEEEEEDNGDEFSASSNASFSCENSSSSSQEAREIDIESDEETEEDAGWSLKRFMRYPLLMFVLVISTLYISSMNSPAFEGLGFDQQRIQNHSYGEFIGYEFLDGKQGQFGLLGLNQGNIEKTIEEEKANNHVEEELVKRSDVAYQIQKNEIAEKIEVVNDKLVKTEEVPDRLDEDVENVRENGGSEENKLDDKLLITIEVDDGVKEMMGQKIASTQDVQLCVLSNHQEDVPHATDSSWSVAEEEAREGIQNEVRDVNTGNVIVTTMETADTMLMFEGAGKSMLMLTNEFQHLGKEVLFGVLTCTAIVAALALRSNIRRRTASKHSIKPIVNEKQITVLSTVTEPLIETTGQVDIKDSYQSLTTAAPSVKLVCEFEVGVGEISSSLKSFDTKSRMKDDVSKADSAPVQFRQDFPEFSTTNSILTPANKRTSTSVRNNNDMQAGSDGEWRNLVTTPLRRSARIRSRALVSP